MRNLNQTLNLLLIAIGVSALSMVPPGGSVRELFEYQMHMLNKTRSMVPPQPDLLLRYGWAIRSGGWLAIVIGAGSLVIPWINALVYRRPTTAQAVH